MSKLLPINGETSATQNTNPETKLQSFALDEHTRQFVDPDYWEGAVEARFHFDEEGLQHREFVGRMVAFCSDTPAIAITEVGGNGQTFIKRTLSSLSNEQLAEPERVAEYWARWLSIAQHPHTPGCPLPVLPTVAMSPSVGRLHYDAKSGFGFVATSNGYCTLVDLRDVESANESHHVYMEFPERFALGVRALVDMPAEEFHARMDKVIHSPGSEAFETMRFYKLGDDERAIEVFGCDYRTLKKTMAALKLALTTAMGPGGELENYQRAMWRPWDGGDRAISVHLSDGWWDDFEAPAKLQKMMGEICAATGCRIRYEFKTKEERKIQREGEDGRIGDARAIALEWGGDFSVWSESASAHAAMEAGVNLREIMMEE